MSEQKMPALPEHDMMVKAPLGPGYTAMFSAYTVERIRAEAIEYGRQQERERLEPLRVAVEAERNARVSYSISSFYHAKEQMAVDAARIIEAEKAVAAAARTLLEQAE